MFKINNLHVSINDQSILHGVNLTIASGQVHALMGPNGSGKSTLAYAMAGHPRYTITKGFFTLDDSRLEQLSPEKRAQNGLFVVFQQPPALPGVRVHTFLKDAYQALTGTVIGIKEFNALLMDYVELLQIDPLFLHRDLHEGFSGGEKKRLEILQILLFKPRMVILDEIDSGLDVDAIKIVARAVAYARQQNPWLALLLITHYKRILEYIVPDYVHVFCKGAFVATGQTALIDEIDARGYHYYAGQGVHEAP